MASCPNCGHRPIRRQEGVRRCRRCGILPDPIPADLVLGRDLREGDAIEVWWAPKRDMIVRLQPYTGGVSHLFKEGAQLATFGVNAGGMTIDNMALYRVLARAPQREAA